MVWKSACFFYYSWKYVKQSFSLSIVTEVTGQTSSIVRRRCIQTYLYKFVIYNSFIKICHTVHSNYQWWIQWKNSLVEMGYLSLLLLLLPVLLLSSLSLLLLLLLKLSLLLSLILSLSFFSLLLY